jgi:rhodanese-related sulfurtransferase
MDVRPLALVYLLGFVLLNSTNGQTTTIELPLEKQTSLGLYVTAKEAYVMWKADPDKVKILDVRTPEEYIYIGQGAMAWNIPAFLQTYSWDAEKKHFQMKPNPDFIDQIRLVFQPDDTLLVMCRSGGRSAMAVNQMAAAGFKNVYNITDGFEGDMVNDPESVYQGQRMKNGWKNSDLPWTYNIDPKLMLIPEAK